MNTQATGAIRPKSALSLPAAPFKPGVLDVLSIAQNDLGFVRDGLPAGSPLWGFVDMAHHALNLALAETETARAELAQALAAEWAGHAFTGEIQP